MKIAIVHFNPMDPLKGGVERVSVILAKELEALGHSIIFISKNIIGDNFPAAYREKQFSIGNTNTDGESRFINIIKENEIDLILNQNGGQENGITQLCASVSVKTGAKLVSVLHINPGSFIQFSFYSTQFFNLKSKLTVKGILRIIVNKILWSKKRKALLTQHEKCYKYTYNVSNAMVLLSNNFIPSFISYSCIPDSHKLSAISNPIDLDEKTDFDKKKQLIWVGRMAMPHKRPDRMVNIWESLSVRYPDWELVMIGDGPDLSDIKDLANRKKLRNIKFVGFQEPDIFYKTASLLCLTSEYEGFGMVLIEALQNGVVPIAYNSYESITDIIETDKNGVLIDAFDQDSYIHRLSQLMSDQSLIAKLKANGPASINKFNVKNIAKQWDVLFLNVINS